MILAGDVGGTSTRLACFELRAGRLHSLVEQTYPSRQHRGLDEIVRTFVAAHNLTPRHACFGIAGPVRQGRVHATNLPWVVDAAGLAAALALPEVGLINDLEANAHGILALEPHDFAVLNAGAADAAGNVAVISAGTGLGEAGMFWDGKALHPFACEGGHTDFGPRDDLEADLLLYLRQRYGHVSYERILSGPGLHNLYDFLRDTRRGEESAEVRERLQREDPAAVISELALAGRCSLCVQALDRFVSLYGAEAGNLALKIMAHGGVYIGGGIAPKILAKMQSPAFLQAFTAKGRMKPLLEAMPVRVVLNDSAALLGAARWSALHASLLEPTAGGTS
jgi:glucokinase